MGKSQISVEFIFAVGVILIIFLVIFGFMTNRSKELSESELKLNKDNTCLLISSLLTSAFVNGDGIVINASIDYNATINVTNINTTYKGLDIENSSYCLLSIHNVADTKLRKGVIEIQNQNNYITIENV